MSTLRYDAKQATAMADFACDRAKAKLDDAIDAEERRDELIAQRTQELVVQRMAAMAPIDVVCGMHSVLENGAGMLIAQSLIDNDFRMVGIYVLSLISEYVKSDSQVMANEWMNRIDQECGDWEK